MAGRIFITGDIHGEPMLRFGLRNWPEGQELDKHDYVIILGDCGLLWYKHRTKSEERNIKWLDDQPWTTLFLDGNHENFEILNKLPTKQFFGSEVGILAHSIYHLKRGQIYWINGRKFLVIGGANSHDRQYRTWGTSMWIEEEVTDIHVDKAIANINAYINKISAEFILTHAAPTEFARQAIAPGLHYLPDNSEYQLSRLLHTEGLTFKKWFFGHYHTNVIDPVHDKWQCLYEDIIELTKDAYEGTS